MARWKETVDLIAVEETLNDEGSPIETRTTTTVFANEFQIGLSAWTAARAAGLHADHVIQVRSFEYAGQQIAVFRGVECEVERVSEFGEFTRLTLARRLSNG